LTLSSAPAIPENGLCDASERIREPTLKQWQSTPTSSRHQLAVKRGLLRQWSCPQGIFRTGHSIKHPLREYTRDLHLETKSTQGRPSKNAIVYGP
jgi:hypothetical protein